MDLYVDTSYTEEPCCIRDPRAIREDICELKQAIERAKEKLSLLNEAREAWESDESGDTEALSLLLEGIEEAENDVISLRDDLLELREELSDSIWYREGGRA